MKILRNFGKIIGSSIFILALTTVAFTIGLTKLTEYDRLKGLVIDLIGTQVAGSVDKNMLTQMHLMFLEECKRNEKIQLSAMAGQDITIECEDVKKTTPDGLIDLFANSLFDNMYYKKYDCSFIECLKGSGQEKYTIFLSLESHSFFKGLQNILLAVSGAGLILMLVSIERWEGRLKGIGISLVSIALPFFVMILLKDRLLPISEDVKVAINPIINQLFSSISNIFLVMLIVGVVLTGSGYLLKHYRKAKVKKS